MYAEKAADLLEDVVVHTGTEATPFLGRFLRISLLFSFFFLIFRTRTDANTHQLVAKFSNVSGLLYLLFTEATRLPPCPFFGLLRH